MSRDVDRYGTAVQATLRVLFAQIGYSVETLVAVAYMNAAFAAERIDDASPTQAREDSERALCELLRDAVRDGFKSGVEVRRKLFLEREAKKPNG